MTNITNIGNKASKESKKARSARLNLADDVLMQLSPLKILGAFLMEKMQSKEQYPLERREILEVMNALDIAIQNIEQVFERA